MLAANWTELERREVTVADGRRALAPYVGPVLVRFENRSCFTGAFVLGEGVLLGSIPLEDVDLVVNSRLQEVTVNPDSPNIRHRQNGALACSAPRLGQRWRGLMRRPQARRRWRSSSSAKSSA